MINPNDESTKYTIEYVRVILVFFGTAFGTTQRAQRPTTDTAGVRIARAHEHRLFPLVLLLTRVYTGYQLPAALVTESAIRERRERTLDQTAACLITRTPVVRAACCYRTLRIMLWTWSKWEHNFVGTTRLI
jgi:hypothetical protein